VLNAAASAAEQPTGTNAFTRSWLRPNFRAITDPNPAPICADGPSRPNAMPLASDAEQQKNFPNTVRNEMRPSFTKSANLVCGIPLPRASGKYRHKRYPVPREPSVGTRMRCQPAPPGGYMRAARRPVRRIKATITRPTSAPIKRLRTTLSSFSFCRSLSSTLFNLESRAGLGLGFICSTAIRTNGRPFRNCDPLSKTIILTHSQHAAWEFRKPN
jgi:hypothetical protein